MRTARLQRRLTPDEFLAFRDLIHERSGIYLEESKIDGLRDSLMTRASRLHLIDYDEYLAVLSSDTEEFTELMNLVTINETSFFRFAEQFRALREVVLPELLETRPLRSGGLRAWSAGCSTGEEVYTIAMTLLDASVAASSNGFRVLGTDVSTDALERARHATYSARTLATVPADVLSRWFEPAAERMRVSSEVRRHCDFWFHNLTELPFAPDLLQGWDLIFCRNVTIYFRPETTRRIVDQFYEALNPGGYLFVGHSETLHSVSTRFETVEAGGVFLYRKPLTEGAERNPAAVPVLGTGRTQRPEAMLAPRAERAERAPRATSTIEPASEAPADAAEVPPTAQRAHRLLAEGRPTDALALANEALAADSRDTEAQLVAAFAHADLGDLDTAARGATAILAADPLVAAANYLLGAIHRESGRVEEALSQFRRTLYVDPEFVLAHFALAGIFQQRGELENASREYENALRALYREPEGDWTAFLGGFRPDLLVASCERGMAECRRVTPAKGMRAIGR